MKNIYQALRSCQSKGDRAIWSLAGGFIRGAKKKAPRSRSPAPGSIGGVAFFFSQISNLKSQID
ncbi:hypothetical protein QT971_24235 [Microcoleus sp. herbarium19]